MKPSLIALAVAAITFSATAQAGEVYTGIGTHGVLLGYAHPISSSFTIRGDFGTFGTYKTQDREEGIDYDIEAKLSRAGVFGDWFPFQGGFRLTGGVTFNNMKLDMLARGNGQPMTVGNRTFVSSPDDRLNVKIEFPKTTPYLGIGYGHQLSKGWGFVFDLGASIGKARVSETHAGPNLGNPALVSQADIDAELAEIRDGVGKIKAIPMLSIGLRYQF